MRGWKTRAAAVVALGIVMGCAAGPRRHAPESASTTASELAPPDGVWRKDAAGREYYLAKLPKAQARRQPDGSVRNAWGVPLQVEREDDANVYYKVFRPQSGTGPSAAAPEPTAADRARVAATYAVRVREQSTLRFTPFGDGLPTRGQWRQGFAIADMNGDGHPDVVHGPPRKRLGPPVVFLGDGAGRWKAWERAAFPALRYDYGDAAAGDLDGDGKPDVALGMHLLGMAALRNGGDGAFADAGRGLDRPGKDGAAASFSSRAVAIVDWDRDGHADILALGEGPRLASEGNRSDAGANGLVLYRGGKDGTWRRYDQGTGQRRAFGPSLALGDFDGDGRPDAATSSSLLGFTEIAHFGNASGGWDTVAVDAVRPAAYVRAVAVGDLDGDGRDDLVLSYASFELATWRNGIDVLFARPGRTWQRQGIVSAETRAGVHALAVGDLDGDGKRDVVALGEQGEISVFRGDGRGGFAREREVPAAYAGGCRGVHVALADLDGDRHDEIVAAFADEPSRDEDVVHCPSGGGITAWKAAPR